MKITYRTNHSIYGIGIQVVSNVDEDLTKLIGELTNIGFKYEKSRIPLSFKNKDNTTTAHFYRDGSDLFGLKTTNEVEIFVFDSKKILKKFDKTFKYRKLYYYDND